jgi:hypothetical protein
MTATMRETDPLPRLFLLSCALCLALASGAKFYTLTGSAKILLLDDPLFGLSNRLVMAMAATAEGLGGLYLFVSRNRANQSTVCIYFSVNFLIYRIWSLCYGIKLCPCLGTVGNRLPLSPAFIDALLWLFLVYMLGGALLIKFADSGPMMAATLVNGRQHSN